MVVGAEKVVGVPARLRKEGAQIHRVGSRRLQRREQAVGIAVVVVGKARGQQGGTLHLLRGGHIQQRHPPLFQRTPQAVHGLGRTRDIHGFSAQIGEVQRPVGELDHLGILVHVLNHPAAREALEATVKFNKTVALVQVLVQVALGLGDKGGKTPRIPPQGAQRGPQGALSLQEEHADVAQPRGQQSQKKEGGNGLFAVSHGVLLRNWNR